MDQRTAHTRLALLDSAEALFAVKGFSGVGNRELVGRAGVNVAAIAYHFGSKRELYLETVRRSILRPEIQHSWQVLAEAPTSRQGAACALAEFIQRITARLLTSSSLNACTSLMLREALQPSEALSDVVENFVRPHEKLLARTARSITPTLTKNEALLAARSILGQVLHQHLFQSFFVSPGKGKDYDAKQIRAIADHLTRFSLRGLGCSAALVKRALHKCADGNLSQ